MRELDRRFNGHRSTVDLRSAATGCCGVSRSRHEPSPNADRQTKAMRWGRLLGLLEVGRALRLVVATIRGSVFKRRLFRWWEARLGTKGCSGTNRRRT